MSWEYKVVYIDFRGRISIEGQEIMIEKGERRSAFVRETLNKLGADGWELGGVHPLWPAETSYMIFKRPAREKSTENSHETSAAGDTPSDNPGDGNTVDLGRTQ